MLEKKIYKPGIHTISNDEYHSSTGISRTGIKEFNRAPKYYWYRYLNPGYVEKEKSNDMDFGSAVHCYILEPEKFYNEFYIMQKNPHHGNSNAGKEFKMEQMKKAGNKLVLSEEEFSILKKMNDTLIDDDQARELISGAQYEKSIYWIDPETKLLCKCRPDIWHDEFVVDLKTTKDASPYAFQNDFYKRGYHLQLAMIAEGIKHTTGKEIKNFIDLAIEKTEPYCHAIYPIDEIALEQGLKEFKEILIRMKECFEKNIWPSYQIQNITLPAYVYA